MSAQLSENQRRFAQAYAATTGLSPALVVAQLIAEEPAGAAWPVGHRDQNWLNIGKTDSKWYAGGWGSLTPEQAGRLSGLWAMGKYNVPGFGKAAAGIIAMTRTAGQPLDTQIAALQRSGWASSGYPDLPSIAAHVSGATPLAASSTASGAPSSTPASSGSGLGGWLARAGLTAALLLAGAGLLGLGISIFFKPLPNARKAAETAALAAA